MKNWAKRIIVAVIVLAIFAVGAIQIPKIWREISFYWTEHTETEWKVKEYADRMGVSY